MAFKIMLLTLAFSSWNILLSEGTATNQTNSTQNSTVVASPTPQTISPTTSSSVIVQASSSISGDALQISASEGSSGGILTRYVVLPPQHERRDYNLIANTKLRWVRYLLDKSGPEFSALKQHVEEHLNKIYQGVKGFIKSEATEFLEEKVTFHAIIYTKIADEVSKSELKAPIAESMLSEKTNEMKIYAFEITPRFTEMPKDQNVAEVFTPQKVKEAETVDGIMSFLQGFGAMLALIVVFASIGFIKYKACKSNKKEDSDKNMILQEAHDNEVVE